MISIRPLAAVLLAAVMLPAQEEATTFAALCQQAEVIVLADVLQRTDPTPQTHETRFRSYLLLKGDDPDRFAIREPAGECCGRALFGLLPGTRQVLFLQQREGQWHLCAGARGVATGDAATVGHLQALLGATDAIARAQVLAAGLEQAEPRICRDSALALWSTPDLAVATPDVTAAIERSALRQLAATSADSCLPYLVGAAGRLHSPAVLNALIDTWVTHQRTDLRALLHNALPGFGLDAAADAIQNRMPADDDGRMRGIGLLAELAGPRAEAALVAVLRGRPAARLQVSAARALLARGLSPNSLGMLVPAAVLEAAQSPAPPRPRLRVVQPESSR